MEYCCLVANSSPTLFLTPWIVVHQAPPSMGFFRQKYWSGLLFPSEGDLPNPGVEPMSTELGRRQWHPTPVLLPVKSHGQRSLMGCSPWGREESDTTEQLHFHFSLSCIGEGMATHSSVPSWRIPGMGEPGELPSMGWHRVRDN